MDHYVYALVDPINKIPLYIGKGRKDRCNGILFGCMKDAYTFYKVSKQTFKKRYDFEIIANL